MENSAVPESAKAINPEENVQRPASAEEIMAQDPNTSVPAEIDATTQDTTMQDTAEEPPLTQGLFALLGGLESPTDAIAASANQDIQESAENQIQEGEPKVPVPALYVESVPAENVQTHPMIPGLFLGHQTEQPAHSEVRTEAMVEDAIPPPQEDAAAKEQPPTVNAEASPNVAEDVTMAEIPADQPNSAVEGAEPVEEEHPEWEVDSSPIESSSDDSSSDDSSDESEDGDNAYKLLSPEEQARILMEGDGGSDDEGGGKAKGPGGQLRTKNEVPDVVIPKPDVTITADMPITEVGAVEHIVDNILLIKAKTSGEYRVLEGGSVLCLEDRTVVGVVAETLGAVQHPLYTVMFTNAGEITEAGLALGTKVFYSEKHSTYVFTQALKAYKGSDASNLHDEEVGDEEIEFSDDEAEAEHKRRVKQKRMEKRGGRMQQNGSGRGGHPSQQQHTPYDASNGISYDDADEDGPYKPLARPASFADNVGRGEAPQESAYTGSFDRQNQFRGRGRGGDRGRGDRGRGHGDRGRGRSGYQDRRNQSNGHSLPPRPPQSFTPSSPFPPAQYQTPSPGRDFSQGSPAPPSIPNFYMPQQNTYSPHQPQMAWPHFPPPPPFPQQFQNGQNGWQPPAMPQGSPAPGGAFINPAFLPGQWNQQQGGSGSGGK